MKHLYHIATGAVGYDIACARDDKLAGVRNTPCSTHGGEGARDGQEHPGQEAALGTRQRNAEEDLSASHTPSTRAPSFVYHHETRRLRCHHCGADRPVPMGCPECGSAFLCKVGHGTERVVE